MAEYGRNFNTRFTKKPLKQTEAKKSSKPCDNSKPKEENDVKGIISKVMPEEIVTNKNELCDDLLKPTNKEDISASGKAEIAVSEIHSEPKTDLGLQK